MKSLVATVLSSLAALALAGEVPPLERFAAEVEAVYPKTPTLSVDAFLQLRSRSSFLIVDAREPAERAVSIIPNAITREALKQRAADSSTLILVYCTIGMRSAAVTRELREQGREAFNLQGGVLAWAAAGQPFVDEQGQPTQRVHVYGKRWSYLPAEFQAVW